MFILLLLILFILFILLFIFDTPTAKLADFLTLASTDACRQCSSPGRRQVNYSKTLKFLLVKLFFVLATAQEAIQNST